MAKLKVFRTASGFHDTYVAVPSRAAALRAWGANTDLFAMGSAEEVTDPKLMAPALTKPGTLFKARRGSAAETQAARKTTPRRKPPSRARLDRAEQALETARNSQAAEAAALDAQIAALEARRAKLAKKHKAALDKLSAARDRAAEDFDRQF